MSESNRLPVLAASIRSMTTRAQRSPMPRVLPGRRLKAGRAAAQSP